jgi:RNA-directed DNA polymerase
LAPTRKLRWNSGCSARPSPPVLWQVPKTLFKAPLGCGLPVGNLTSQFFATVYLDSLDQFVTHRLKARDYLRYCDDLLP